jgi:glutathione S-transferase
MEKGDPDMRLLLGAKAPEVSLLKEGGIESGVWKKDAKIGNRL